jgi:hypothetical protein
MALSKACGPRGSWADRLTTPTLGGPRRAAPQSRSQSRKVLSDDHEIGRSFSWKMAGQNSGGRLHPIWLPETVPRPCATARRKIQMGNVTLSAKVLTARVAWRLKNDVKNISDDNLETSATACEMWGWGCGGLLLIGLLAELALVLIHPAYNPPWERWGNVLAASLVWLGVGGKIQFRRMGFRREREITRRSRDELAVVELKRAKLEAKLEAELQPRMTDQRQFDLIHTLRGKVKEISLITTQPRSRVGSPGDYGMRFHRCHSGRPVPAQSRLSRGRYLYLRSDDEKVQSIRSVRNYG